MNECEVEDDADGDVDPDNARAIYVDDVGDAGVDDALENAVGDGDEADGDIRIIGNNSRAGRIRGHSFLRFAGGIHSAPLVAPTNRPSFECMYCDGRNEEISSRTGTGVPQSTIKMLCRIKNRTTVLKLDILVVWFSGPPASRVPTESFQRTLPWLC